MVYQQQSGLGTMHREWDRTKQDWHGEIKLEQTLFVMNRSGVMDGWMDDGGRSRRRSSEVLFWLVEWMAVIDVCLPAHEMFCINRDDLCLISTITLAVQCDYKALLSFVRVTGFPRSLAALETPTAAGRLVVYGVVLL